MINRIVKLSKIEEIHSSLGFGSMLYPNGIMTILINFQSHTSYLSKRGMTKFCCKNDV